MIFGVGIDLIEVRRIEKLLKNDDLQLQKIFTEHEIDYCRKLANGSQHFAGRFAAKEAFLKALGKGWREEIKFRDIETINNELGKPEIILYGKTKSIFEAEALKCSHVSISHLKDYATAIVLIEK
ncbi:MAG: holo-ACP synthase [Candidatus Cloacimonetes bacterium]|nr:holo-ACP synthase [Candidatus Cloacimonadota bacterium]